MKRIITLSLALAISAISFAQSLTATSTSAANMEGSINRRTWSISNGLATVNLGSSSPFSDYVYFGGFNLAAIPNNAIINTLSVTITRGSTATVVDSSVRLVLNGSLYYANNVTASTTPTTWPTTRAASIYSFPQASISFLTGADLKNAGFGIAISARRTANSPTASVGSVATLNVSYLVLAPILLTDFTVGKNADNSISIRFATSSEENVSSIFVERSADGVNFQKLFTLAPKGSRNVYTRYEVTDKSPLNGNNYYRVSELDKDGNAHYYTTKLVTLGGKAKTFNAYYNGGQIIANLGMAPGQYEVSVIDMAGVTVNRKTVSVTSSSAQIALDAPSRTGIYVVVLKGQATSESIRVPVTR